MDLRWFDRRIVSRRPVQALLAAAAFAGAVAGPASGAGAELSPGTVTETEAVGPGVRHTELELVEDGSAVVGDLLEVNLRNPNVSVDLVYPGVVAARQPVSEMADRADAVAAVNGDFFNIGQTNAPTGPAVADGQPLKAAVPQGQRYGPGAPGRRTEDVFVIGADRTGRLDRLTLQAGAITAEGTIPIAGLNQYAIRVDGIGAFNADWGTASRLRATCGTDMNRNAPCSDETAEVVVDDGVVTAINDRPGDKAIPADSFVLVGRESGADVLTSQLEVGDTVNLEYALAPTGGSPVEAAVGGAPILRDGQTPAGLDDTAIAPRTAAGVSDDGTRLYLLTVDGRSAASRGLTLLELALIMEDLGADDAMNLDGGGSSALVAREPGAASVTVQNVPSDGSERPVPNGLGVFVNAGDAGNSPR